MRSFHFWWGSFVALLLVLLWLGNQQMKSSPSKPTEVPPLQQPPPPIPAPTQPTPPPLPPCVCIAPPATVVPAAPFITEELRWAMAFPSNLPRENCPAAGFLAEKERQFRIPRDALFHECPKPLIRIGGAGDGGKLYCPDRDLGPGCRVYSIGSNLDFSFETEIVSQFGCEVFTFDCTVDEKDGLAKAPPGVVFKPWCIGPADGLLPFSTNFGHMKGKLGQYYTLKSAMGQLGHEKCDLLKMDIERHEYGVFRGWANQSAGQLPRQVLVEFHLHNAYEAWGGPVTYQEWSSTWVLLANKGYRVVSYEPNPMCPCCCEYSLIRFDF